MVSWRIDETDAPLDSRPGLQHLWFNWRAIGMHPPQRYRPLYYVYSVLVNFVFAFCMPATMLMNLYFVDSMQELIDNLYLSCTIVMATAKQFSIWSYRRNLLQVNDCLPPLDARSSAHRDDRQHIVDAMLTSRRLYLTFMVLFFLPSAGFAYLGASQRKLIYQAWFPAVFDDPELNLTATLIYQNGAIITFFVLQNVNNDVYPQCYLVLLIGHIRALAARIRRIGENPLLSADDNMQELLRCIQDHKIVLSYFDCIQPVISRTIFIQFTITGTVLCLTAVNYVTLTSDTAQLLIAGTYILAVLIEALPCCWCVNTLMHECGLLTLAMYSCRWFEQHPQFRRTLVIFMQRSQKISIIMAGGLLPVTLQTFLAIIRFSFSMYTILKS